MQPQRSMQGSRQAGSEHRGQHGGSAGAQRGKSGRQRSLGAGPKTSVPLRLSRPSSCFIRGLLLGRILLPTSACDRPVVPQLHVTALLFEPLRRRELDVLSVTSMTHLCRRLDWAQVALVTASGPAIRQDDLPALSVSGWSWIPDAG